MKFALITTLAALGFASTAIAQDSYDTPTVMTRNVPVETVFGPQDSGAVLSEYATVTFGQTVELELSDAFNPNIDTGTHSDTIVAYAFGSSGNASAYDLLAR